MAKWNHTVARLCLDRLIERPSLTGCAAEICGGSSKLLFLWMNRAKDEQEALERGDVQEDELQYRLIWPEDHEGNGTPIFFNDAVRLAQKLYAINAHTHNMELLAGEVVYSPLTGEPLWEIDEVVRAKFDDKESARIMGYDDFPYKHDPRTGGRIPVRRQGPAQMRIHTLRSVLPAVYDLAEKHENVTTVRAEHLRPEPLRADGSSPLTHDLQARLADLRANGPRNARPDAPIDKGRPDDEPPTAADASAAARPDVPLADHPRAYWTEPPPEPPPPPLPPRPQSSRADQSGIGKGTPLPGGFRSA